MSKDNGDLLDSLRYAIDGMVDESEHFPLNTRAYLESRIRPNAKIRLIIFKHRGELATSYNEMYQTFPELKYNSYNCHIIEYPNGVKDFYITLREVSPALAGMEIYDYIYVEGGVRYGRENTQA